MGARHTYQLIPVSCSGLVHSPGPQQLTVITSLTVTYQVTCFASAHGLDALSVDTGARKRRDAGTVCRAKLRDEFRPAKLCAK